MAIRRRARSAASVVFVALVIAVVVVTAALAAVLLWTTQQSVTAESERVTRTLALALADTPAVQNALADDTRTAATAVLQPVAARVMTDARIDFITIMEPDGTRVTHRDVSVIGETYIGTIPQPPATFTEEYTGTLGPSLRTITPVYDDGRLVGWVSVGVTTGSIGALFLERLPVVAIAAIVAVAAGFAVALVVRRVTRRVTGDLSARGVRETLSSYESMRTLGEALRVQTHEHGNRMHTAASLVELGRIDEAIALLTEASRQSQALVDVAAGTSGDPAVGALLLGKASQAAERGIRWETHIDAEAPGGLLPPMEMVSLVGNLVDNALDAAAAGLTPRWVSTRLSPDVSGTGLIIEVADSGAGVPAELRERIFQRGFSTKASSAGGRGVGLALVGALVRDAGGTVEIGTTPSRFTVTLPGGGAA